MKPYEAEHKLQHDLSKKLLDIFIAHKMKGVKPPPFKKSSFMFFSSDPITRKAAEDNTPDPDMYLNGQKYINAIQRKIGEVGWMDGWVGGWIDCQELRYESPNPPTHPPTHPPRCGAAPSRRSSTRSGTFWRNSTSSDTTRLVPLTTIVPGSEFLFVWGRNGRKGRREEGGVFFFSVCVCVCV